MTHRTLRDKLLENDRKFSLSDGKPQNLSRQELVDALTDFLLEAEQSRIEFRFGDSVDKAASPAGTRFFDPIVELGNNPGALERITNYVEADMAINEAELINEAKTYQSSYNSLLFGAAIKIARNDTISEELREFLVEHLIDPKAPANRKQGRPKQDPYTDRIKYRAVVFATLHGLSATRNEASAPNSACDIVADAALKLKQSGYKEFNIGYSYESLKKTYYKESPKTRN